MTLAYNRTLTPLPADAAGRMIEGRSEGEVDATYPPVERAITSGAIKLLGNPEAPASDDTDDSEPDPEPSKKKSSSKKTSSSSSSSEKKSSSSTKKTSSKKADEPDEEN